MAGKAKFKLARGLDAKIAGLIRREVTEVARDVHREAVRLAPAVKEWTTQRDIRVRPTHVVTDRQQRPSNLRFALPSHPWDMGIGREPDSEGKPRVGPISYFDHPGEQVVGAYVNWVHCRCFLEHDPQGIARKIKMRPALVTGTKVSARVWVTAPLIVEAELGDVYPGGMVAEGTFFMHRAAKSGARLSKARR